MSDTTQDARNLIADARAGRLDVDGLASTAEVLVRAIRLLETLCEEVDATKRDNSLEAAQVKSLESQRELATSRGNQYVDLSAEVSRLQTELAKLQADRLHEEESTRSVVDLLAQVMRGTYQWPSGVAWVVREAHRRLTGGPPDGLYARARRRLTSEGL